MTHVLKRDQEKAVFIAAYKALCLEHNMMIIMAEFEGYTSYHVGLMKGSRQLEKACVEMNINEVIILDDENAS